MWQVPLNMGVCGNEPTMARTRGGMSRQGAAAAMARTRGEAITAPNAIAAAAAPALGVWVVGGGIYISEALLGVSPYFSRSSEVL